MAEELRLLSQRDTLIHSWSPVKPHHTGNIDHLPAAVHLHAHDLRKYFSGL